MADYGGVDGSSLENQKMRLQTSDAIPGRVRSGSFGSGYDSINLRDVA